MHLSAYRPMCSFVPHQSLPCIRGEGAVDPSVSFTAQLPLHKGAFSKTVHIRKIRPMILTIGRINCFTDTALRPVCFFAKRGDVPSGGTGDARLCRTGMTPHFLFTLPKRKRPFTLKRKGRLGRQNDPLWGHFAAKRGAFESASP